MRKPRRETCLFCKAKTFTSEGILVAHLTPYRRSCPGKWQPNTQEATERVLAETEEQV